MVYFGKEEKKDEKVGDGKIKDPSDEDEKYKEQSVSESVIQDGPSDMKSLDRWSIIFRDDPLPCTSKWFFSFSSQFSSAFSLCMQTKTGVKMKETTYRDLLHKIVRFETYLPVGTLINEFLLINVPTNR